MHATHAQSLSLILLFNLFLVVSLLFHFCFVLHANSIVSSFYSPFRFMQWKQCVNKFWAPTVTTFMYY